MIGALRRKHLDKWMRGYAKHLAERARAPRVAGPRHLLFAFCDHYEPRFGKVDERQGDDRVKAWEEEYPKMARSFVDADGRAPQHSFFFPGEEYAPSYLDRLGKLVKAGLGEVEMHLHHDNDTSATLRERLSGYLRTYASHGHLSRDSDGRARYAFIHGNWCLANARSDGKWCGVDDELPLLFQTGCYADYTFPSAPDESQPNIVNQIYWPEGPLSEARSYENGSRARVGDVRRDRILMIEGPLSLSLRRHRLPVRIENAAVTAEDPPTPARIRSWVGQGIHVEGRPEWIFVKVHTHGASEVQGRALLGAGSAMLHRELTTRYNDGRRWVLHYVTAREMFNIALAAMEGRSGDPAQYRDHGLSPPPIAG
jgi:hypothetical protein